MFDSTCSRQKGLKRLTEHKSWYVILFYTFFILPYAPFISACKKKLLYFDELFSKDAELLESDSKTALMLHKTNLIINKFCLFNFLFLKNPENKLHHGFHKNIKHSFYKIENSASQYLQE